MTYVADLHLHSPFAMGTSRDLSLEGLAQWAKIKGIDLLSTGDFTHPAWFAEIKETLRDAGDGLYELGGVRFVLGTEVNCSAEQGGRHRRVHVLLFAPSLEAAERINAALADKGRLAGDARPTLRTTPRDLVCTLLDIDPRCLVVPAHAWTPWFGVFGSKSGFDSLEECFGDTVGHIHAVETGLSSNPAMNWRMPGLDHVSIVSFSDAHSLPKLGREATVMRGELSYEGMVKSLRGQDIAYTVEFFPEEGQYHYSGHRRCGVSFSPRDVEARGTRCPVCGRSLTLGVMQRVEELTGREVETWTDSDGLTRARNGRPPFMMLVPLQEVLAESLGSGPNTKRVQAEYSRLVAQLGGELSVLARAPVADVARLCGERVAEGISRVRRGDIAIEPGYDGRYGTVRVWPEA